jgi:hypothetical protein
MSRRTRLLRLAGGLAIIAVLLGIALPLQTAWIHTWGATQAEVARTYPGDALLSRPVIFWTHATTIQAPPEQVWPWIAQIGERRGGFYSYTFIENLVAGEDLYHNANRIIPELQDPQPGEEIIGGAMKIREVEPGAWLLADSTNEIGWTWLWHLTPLPDGRTRLIVRTRIQPPPEMDGTPLLGWVMDAGGFVMERRMIEGIRDRAEGRVDPPYSEAVEILLWVAALLAGAGGGLLFLWRRPWAWSLGVGIASVLCLVLFTFVQPPIGVRMLLVGMLWVGLWRARQVAMASVQR